MNSRRIAVLAGVIGVLCAVIKIVPALLLGRLFEQGTPGWLPTVGTVGQTLAIAKKWPALC